MERIPELFAPNLICVCIDEFSAQNCQGRLYTQYDAEPFPFLSLIDMTLQMDHFFDEWDFPQSSTIPRTFRKSVEFRRRQSILESGRPMDHARVYSQSGKTSTFVIRVKYRQNATWQGEIVWLEESLHTSFRSALELLRILQDALESSGSGEDA